MQKILLGIAALALLGVMSFTVTRAFFTSTAESAGNTFTAGDLNLTIDLDAVGGGFKNSFASNETPGYGNLAPGGDTADLSARLRNEGTTDALAIGIAASHDSNYVAAQMRITELTWKGKNLLVGGAGADIDEYVAPVSCDYTVSTAGSLQSVITSALDNEVVCVDSGNYPGNLVIDDEITLVALNAPDSTNKATIVGRIDVTANNVTVRGFEITNPSAGYGAVFNDVIGGTLEHNVFTEIGSSGAVGNTQAAYLNNSSAVVKDNIFTKIGSLGSSQSVKAIFVGDSTEVTPLAGIVIENNRITNIKAVPSAKGAYGILINHNGTTGAAIKNNTITDLEGLWAHAIGLEGDTLNASVTHNNISNIVDHKSPADAVAVFFEANDEADSVVVNNNNLVAPWGLAVHSGLTFTGTLNATNNWWGTFTPPSVVYKNGNSVDISSAKGGPVVGFVNNNDQNTNGYADLADLALSPITNATPGLDAGEIGQLNFFVQLDGPTTGNSFQGVQLTSDFTYTLGQVME